MNFPGEISLFQPDVVQVPIETEPTYINNQSNDDELPSYSNQMEQNIPTKYLNQR